MVDSPVITLGTEARHTGSLRAWIVKAYGDQRSYKGNLGYVDEFATQYGYDNFVPCWRQLDVGHVLIVSSKGQIEGVACVRDVDSWQDTKDRLSCSSCKRPHIKYRRTLGHYSCQEAGCRAKFQTPLHSVVACTRSVARYEGAFVKCPEGIGVTQQMIKDASPSYNAQNAIVPIDLAKIDGQQWITVRAALDALLGERRALEIAEPAGQAEAQEGAIRFGRHRRRERNPRLVALKKADVLARDGRLACEACEFDFAAFYGRLGEGFAECHHRTPLGELTGKTTTRLADLAIVCANCHRVLHRKRARGMTVEQLRERIEQR